MELFFSLTLLQLLTLIFFAVGNSHALFKFLESPESYINSLEILSLLGRLIMIIYLLPSIVFLITISLFFLLILAVISILNIIINLLFIRKANWHWIWE